MLNEYPCTVSRTLFTTIDTAENNGSTTRGRCCSWAARLARSPLCSQMAPELPYVLSARQSDLVRFLSTCKLLRHTEIVQTHEGSPPSDPVVTAAPLAGADHDLDDDLDHDPDHL